MFTDNDINDSQCMTMYLNSSIVVTSIRHFIWLPLTMDLIGNVMVRVLASIAVDYGFEPWLSQTKDYKIDICCFSPKHATLRSKNSDWLDLNQDNVSEWSDMSTHGLFQWVGAIKIKLCIWSLYNWKIAHLALSNKHSLTPFKHFNEDATWVLSKTFVADIFHVTLGEWDLILKISSFTKQKQYKCFSFLCYHIIFKFV